MIDLPHTKQQWIGFATWVLIHSVVEFWLGKTKRTESNSVIELILTGLKLIWRKK